MIFGIIGLGRFGTLWANSLLSFGQVVAYDKNSQMSSHHQNIKITSLPEVCQADVLFLLVPISEFEKCCLHIKSLLSPHTLVVDACSVKVFPANVMRKIFISAQSLVATHPLFGPDSVKRTGGLKDHQIVVCPIQGDQKKQHQLLDLFHRMGLKTLLSTPDLHDQQMAKSQGLVHFIGRGLAALALQQQELATPDFQALLSINNMVVNDTWQLFLDMHRYNPYTREIRKKLIQQLSKLDNEINKEEIHHHAEH